MLKPQTVKAAKDTKRDKISKNGRVITDIVYLIEKYVKKDQINFSRDTVIAKRLLKSFPEIEFWKGLEVKHLCNTLAIFGCAAAKDKLKSLHRRFKQRLSVQAKIVTEEKQVYHFEVNKVGEDLPTPPYQPKSILDFLRKAK
jgi:hypothetical protein